MHVRAVAEVVASRGSRRSRASRSSRSARAPCPAFCVEVKPRKSSDVSGIRSAPGICAASAIFFGSDCRAVEAAAGEPAADRRELEELRVAEALLGVEDVRAHVGAQQDRDVVRLEPRVGRVAGEAPRVDQHRLVRPAGRAAAAAASGRARAGRKYGSPHATVTPRPGGRRRVVAVERGEQRLELALRVDAGRSPTPSRAPSPPRGGAAARAPRSRSSARP